MARKRHSITQNNGESAEMVHGKVEVNTPLKRPYIAMRLSEPADSICRMQGLAVS